MTASPPFAAETLHLGEFLPPLVASIVYLTLFGRRVLTLAHSGRPVATWRMLSFLAGVVLLVSVQIGPVDSLADEVLMVHMLQHIVIGDLCSLLIVLGLTGPVLAPLLQIRVTRPLRTLANPIVALVLWAVDLYAWHLPLLYQLAIHHDLVHALEHACLLWFGTLLWLGLIGPLPKPAWFKGWGEVAYVAAIRLAGAVLANALIWAQALFYPVYRASDATRGLNPVSDQNIAGAIMMVEQIILTVILFAWVFLRFARRDEERQQLLDLAEDRGISLSGDRAVRAANAGAAGRLRERLMQAPAWATPEAEQGDAQPGPPVEGPAADELWS